METKMWICLFGVIVHVVVTESYEINHVQVTGQQIVDDDGGDVCSGVMCGAGRECYVIKDNAPSCRCRKTCPDLLNTLCGTDGESYDNHCYMHRAACTKGIHIRRRHNGLCKKDQKGHSEVRGEEFVDKPLVCFQVERDHLRMLMIEWLRKQSASKGKTNEVLADGFKAATKSQFYSCDVSKDGVLDTEEFLSCIDSTPVNKDTDATSGVDRIIRSLCVDSLVGLSDTNNDWLIDLREFERGMDPTLHFKNKKCSLEGGEYADGSEAQDGCNMCVCACGNWVCTNNDSCDKTSNSHKSIQVVKGPLPSKRQQIAFLKGFKFARAIDAETIQNYVYFTEQTP